LSFKHLDPQARKVRQVLQAQLVQRVAQVLLVLLPPLPSALSHLARLPQSPTADHPPPQSSTSSLCLEQQVLRGQPARQELQDQPQRSRLVASHLAPQPPSRTLGLVPPLSLTLFSCQVQLVQLEQPARLALLALQPRLQLAPSRKALPLR
jgi:hypothetical protein